MAEPRSDEPANEPYALLNRLRETDARAALLRCCGSKHWVDGVLARRPFASASDLSSAAHDVWSALEPADYLDAFAEHPAIGGDLSALEARFAATTAWSSAEQAGVKSADQATLRALAAGNRAYRERFGYTFIVCATGKSAEAMLGALVERLANDADTELLAAAKEQEQIILLRLAKLASGAGSQAELQ